VHLLYQNCKCTAGPAEDAEEEQEGSNEGAVTEEEKGGTIARKWKRERERWRLVCAL